MEVVTLEAQGEKARFVPGFGCNCIGYRIGSLELITGPPSMNSLRAAPFDWGIPVLFPWPGRLARAKFVWRGREHQLPVNERARGNALHGLVYNRPFRVVRRRPFFIRCELDWAADGDLETWPYPFLLRLEGEVGNGLRIGAEVINSGDRPMPFGFGLHPYFNAPLGPDGGRATTKIQLAAAKRWPLGQDLIPQGTGIEVEEKFDLRNARALGEEEYDDAFTGVTLDSDGRARARLIAPETEMAVEVNASADFSNWVVYAPKNRKVVSIEPYTCAPDALNLVARGEPSGVRELAPGESWSGSIEIRLSVL